MLELASYSHLKESFMNKFEEARINAGITVTELSREANISRSTINKMEKSEPVKAELAVRACRVLSLHLGTEVTYQSLEIRVL
ncbi:XRE family transcriptional regulator [Ktedonosporobacter rubrisoli]|uniref:XRE family transcriptional regulator n=1 Tax=Ktedonosporobacter rubrisoli TaxID=2509675 RepID=A0A4P6K406_KTERU|nr:XRE family transcriptional regulator [Ktedonosporobacter rubrisoli]